MYAALFGIIPGPLWLRILISVIVVGAVLFALAGWVFPFIDSMMTPAQVTVN